MKNNVFMSGMAMFEKKPDEAPAQTAPAQETRLLTDIVTKIPAKKRGIAEGYYLDKAVVQAVEREAKRRGLKKSQLANEVLKRVLLES